MLRKAMPKLTMKLKPGKRNTAILMMMISQPSCSISLRTSASGIISLPNTRSEWWNCRAYSSRFVSKDIPLLASPNTRLILHKQVKKPKGQTLFWLWPMIKVGETCHTTQILIEDYKHLIWTKWHVKGFGSTGFTPHRLIVLLPVQVF